jgi:adenosylcobinamide-GDP ribazoletransferase
MRAFFAALSFLTIVPAPRWLALTPYLAGRALYFFPLVGAILGGIAAAVGFLPYRLFPLAPQAGVLLGAQAVLLCWVVITRALHVDGFADFCEAVVTSGPPQKKIAIMQEPYLGTFGVCALVLLMLTKFCLLACLFVRGGFWPEAMLALLAVPALGRWSMAVLAYLASPPGEMSTLGRLFATSGTFSAAALGAIVPGALLVILAGSMGLLVLLLGILCPLLVRSLALRHIGMVSGDVFGACCELCELTGLLALLMALY